MKKIIYIIIFIAAVSAVIGYFKGNSILSSITFGLIKSEAFNLDGASKSQAELKENTESNIKFYKTIKKMDFSGEDGEKMEKLIEKQVLESMINSAAIEKIASQRGILVSDSDIQRDLEAVISEVGDKETLEKNLADAFGWTIEDFKNNVVKKQVLEQKLVDFISKDESLNADAYKKIEDVLSKAKSGQDFAELAKEYSDCPSSQQGGSLGDFVRIADDPENKYPHMVESFEKAAFALEPGQISDIVKTQFGYHIIKLESKTADAGGIQLANARHILVKTKGFSDWLAEQKKTMNIKISLEDYVWKDGAVEFKNEDMRKFEEEKAPSLLSS